MPVTITSKGQVTIPKRFREHLAVKAGSKVDFMIDLEGHVVLRRADHKKGKSALDRWIGFIKDGPTTDEIMAMTRGEDWSNRK